MPHLENAVAVILFKFNSKLKTSNILMIETKQSFYLTELGDFYSCLQRNQDNFFSLFLFLVFFFSFQSM